MEANLRWQGGMQFLAEADSGHALVLDGPPDLGGRNTGVRPMEMILMGLGGCTGVDVVHILKKSRQAVEDVEVKLSAERADTDPKVFTKIHVHFLVKGDKLNPKHVSRAVELSAEKYCSASLMLRGSVEITHSHEIIE
ncbi:MAG: OsmC family protein [Gammaproteobacteria bacterium]|nr:OsmC family protein [Gammaproteobacteria bacterium]